MGLKELKVHLTAFLNDLAATPVEAVPPHYMRVAEPRGRLGELFPNDWRPAQKPLLQAVLQENRRWFAHYWKEEYDAVQLVNGQPSAAILKLTGLPTTPPSSISANARDTAKHSLRLPKPWPASSRT